MKICHVTTLQVRRRVFGEMFAILVFDHDFANACSTISQRALDEKI